MYIKTAVGFYSRVLSAKGYGYVFVECMPPIVEEDSGYEDLEVDVVGMEDGETYITIIAVAEAEASSKLCHGEEAIPSTGVRVDVVEMEDVETHNTIITVAEAEASSKLCHGEEAIPSTGVRVDVVEKEDVETHDTSTIAVAEAEASSQLCHGEEAVRSSGVAVDAMELEDVCAADKEEGALGDGEAAHQPETLPQKVGKKKAFRSFFSRVWKALKSLLCCCCSVEETE